MNIKVKATVFSEFANKIMIPKKVMKDILTALEKDRRNCIILPGRFGKSYLYTAKEGDTIEEERP